LVIPASALAYDTPMAQSAKAAIVKSAKAVRRSPVRVPGLKVSECGGLRPLGKSKGRIWLKKVFFILFNIYNFRPPALNCLTLKKKKGKDKNSKETYYFNG